MECPGVEQMTVVYIAHISEYVTAIPPYVDSLC